MGWQMHKVILNKWPDVRFISETEEYIWCYTMLERKTWKMDFGMSRITISFQNEQDATMFRLKFADRL